MTPQTCSVSGCECRTIARGFCTMHYQRWHHHGDPNIVLAPKGLPVLERLMSRVVVRDGCWEWQGATDGAGYGVIQVAGRPRGTHRVSYELQVGEIPAGLHLDHLCRNPPCVNPFHLEPVTPRENWRRGESRASRFSRLGVCQRNHELTPDNIYESPSGRRQCLTCRRLGIIRRQAA